MPALPSVTVRAKSPEQHTANRKRPEQNTQQTETAGRDRHRLSGSHGQQARRGDTSGESSSQPSHAPGTALPCNTSLRGALKLGGKRDNNTLQV